jgi:hypothetical protein
MTPRRYLASTLTVDNRDLASQAEGLTDEVQALRRGYHQALALLFGLVHMYGESQQECADLRRQNDGLAELVRVRDEQISNFQAGVSEGVAGEEGSW